MADQPSKLLPLLTWRGALCDSSLSAVQRHVALTLSLYMNERGGSAFPGTGRLVHDTGLSRRAIQEALTGLVDQGWLVITERGGPRPGGNRATAYQAVIPEGGSAPGALGVVQEVHPISPYNSP